MSSPPGDHDPLDDGWVPDDGLEAYRRARRARRFARASALRQSLGVDDDRAVVEAAREARRVAALSARRVAAHTARMAAQTVGRVADDASVSATPMRRKRATWPRVDATHAVECREVSERSPRWRATTAARWFGAGGLGAAIALYAMWTAVSGPDDEATRVDSLRALALATSEPVRPRATAVASVAAEAPLAVTLYAPPKTFAQHVADARLAASTGRLEDALDATNRALALRRDGRVLDLKARILLRMEELSWALEVATEAVYTPPERAGPWLTKGIIHHELDQPDHAQFALERYLDLAPRSPGARRARRILDSL